MSLSKQSVGGLAAIPTMLWAAYLKSLQNNPKLTKVRQLKAPFRRFFGHERPIGGQTLRTVTFELPTTSGPANWPLASLMPRIMLLPAFDSLNALILTRQILI